MKLSQLEKLKSALRRVKTGIIMSIMIHSAIMADVTFHSANVRTTVTLSRFWIAASIPIIFAIWLKVIPTVMQRINITRCYFINLILIAVMLGILNAAMQPITDATIWINSTLHLAHKTYPPYLNAWVNFCASLGAHLCMISSINLAINWQPTVTATTTDS